MGDKTFEVDVLIVGAGPTGMAAALSLSDAGKNILIIDKHEKGIGFSRAIFVNPQTLKSLAPYGVTKKITERGIQVSGLSVRGKHRQILYADLTQQKNEPAFNAISLPQLETEQCMMEALEERNVHIQKPLELINFTQDEDGVTAILQHPDNSEKKIVRAKYIIGADGYHSITRQILGIKYPTENLPCKLLGVDAEIKWPFIGSTVSWILNEGMILGFQINENKARFASIPTDLLKKKPELIKLENITWQTEFEIHFSQVLEYGKNRVWLAGDAAHAHSPIGGRGLNMGVADALRLAKAILDGDFVSYQKERYKINSSWVSKNKFLTRFLAKQGFIGKLNRMTLRMTLRIAAFISERAIGKKIFRNVTGT